MSETLEELYCSGACPIQFDHMVSMKKLRILDCSNNVMANNVNIFGGTLEELYCYGNYMTQEGITDLKKLRILNCVGNNKIDNVNHLADTLVSLSGQPCTYMC